MPPACRVRLLPMAKLCSRMFHGNISLLSTILLFGSQFRIVFFSYPASGFVSGDIVEWSLSCSSNIDKFLLPSEEEKFGAEVTSITTKVKPLHKALNLPYNIEPTFGTQAHDAAHIGEQIQKEVIEQDSYDNCLKQVQCNRPDIRIQNEGP